MPAEIPVEFLKAFDYIRPNLPMYLFTSIYKTGQIPEYLRKSIYASLKNTKTTDCEYSRTSSQYPRHFLKHASSTEQY